MFKWLNILLAVGAVFFLGLSLINYSVAFGLFDSQAFVFNSVFTVEKWNEMRWVFGVYALVLFVGAFVFWRKSSAFQLEWTGLMGRWKWPKLPLLFYVVLVLGIGVRIWSFGPIHYDEAFTYLEYGRSPIGYSAISYSYFNNHIFHSFLVRLFTLGLGNELWVIRAPAFVGGVFVMVVTFLLARKKWGALSGVVAMGLVAFSEFLIGYSVNARGYSLMVSVFLYQWYLIEHEKEGGLKTLAQIVLHTIGFWLVPSYLFAWVFLVVIQVFKSKTNFNWSLILGLFGGFLVYLAPYVYSGFMQTGGDGGLAIQWQHNIGLLFMNSLPLSTKGELGFAVLTIILVCAFFFKRFRPIGFGVLAFIGVLFLVGKPVPPRSLQFFIPVMAILVAGMFGAYVHQKWSWVFILVIMGSWLSFRGFHGDYEESLDDLPEVLESIQSNKPYGLFSKIPLDYPIRYYQTINPDPLRVLKGKKDTVYVIVAPHYQETLEGSYREKLNEYDFEEPSRVKNFLIYRGFKRTKYSR